MEGQKKKVPTIPQITQFWTVFSQAYSKIDSCTQTFYYTLVHMLELQTSKHILEVACGTCRLLPLAINIKPKEATYLATDLTPSMIELSHKNIQKHIDNVGVKDSCQNWLVKQNVTIKVANGEEPIESPHKFDRIIANLVLMATEDPLKMLKNFHSMAAEGCLLGVTIWGEKALSNFMTILPEAMKANGAEPPPSRNPFHLYGKLPELADQSGWEIILSWDQNAPFPHTQIDKELMDHIKFQTKGNQNMTDFFVKRVKEIFDQKKTLNFPCQLAILKKK